MAIGQCIACINPVVFNDEKRADIRKSLINNNASNRKIIRRRQSSVEAAFHKDLVFKYQCLLL